MPALRKARKTENLASLRKRDNKNVNAIAAIDYADLGADGDLRGLFSQWEPSRFADGIIFARGKPTFCVRAMRLQLH